MFIGREDELDVLRREYDRTASALVPIYGRRRVGKSELILRFLEGRRGIYFLGKVAAGDLQMREFLGEAARVVGEPLLAELSTGDWKKALLAVTQRWTGPKKLVLVLDEFQWMAEASPELPSVLQECWDRHWRNSDRIMVILCGSFIGFMEREVLGEKSPLFGRRTAQILLRPFGHRDAARFHPAWSEIDQACAYFVCGGMPLYHRCFDPRMSFERNLETALLDEYAPLFREPEFLLREELREVPRYNAVLQALSGGSRTYRDIAKATGLEERGLDYYVRQLMSLGYVGRRHPLTGEKTNRRAVRFVLEESLLRFWFRFVFPNLSFIRQMGPRRALQDRVKPFLPAYLGACFERLCRDALPRIYEREGVSAAFTIGEYWDKNVQIDVVGLRDDRWTDLGECKWGAIRSPAALAREIEDKVRAYPNQRGATIGRRAFVRRMPKSGPPKGSPVVWHDLEDLYR